MRGDLEPALEAARSAVAVAESAGDTETLVRALTALAEIEGTMAVGDPVDRLRQASALEETTQGVPIALSPQTYLGRWHMRSDDLTTARELLEAQAERAAELGDEGARPVILYMLCELEVRSGNWERADAYAGQYRDVMRLDEVHVLGHEVRHWTQALVDAHRGRIDAAREHAEAGMEAATGAGRQGWLLRNRAVLGFIELSLGEYAAAAERFELVLGKLAEMGVRDPGVYPVRQDAIEALIGVGDLDRAEAEIVALEERARELDRPWALCVAARCRGLLLAAQGDLDGALASLEQAIVEHERLPMPFERARTLLALGQVQRRVKQRRAARETLESAQAIFEELGAVLWVTKAREELARIGGRKASAGGLTPTEQRVAKLVAEGRTNKEVAAALFVSVKTVEANLSRVYAKLGIRSRAELASSLAAVKL
jgi:DNA-binding CsgD family transcriptional regulator